MSDENNYYKVDSTKGSSLIQPLKYKHDVLTQTWIDSRVLATLCVWMESNEVYARTLSEVVRRPLEMIVERLVEGGQAKMVEHTTEAREILQRRFRAVLNRDGKGMKNVMHNTILSSIRPEAQGNDSEEKNSKTQELVNEAIRKYKELFPDVE